MDWRFPPKIPDFPFSKCYSVCIEVRARATRTALFVCEKLGRARLAVCACDTDAWDSSRRRGRLREKGCDGVSNSDSFYHRKRHKAWRAAVLKKAGGLCEVCRRYGRRMPNGEPVPAIIAHHKLHADEYPELRYVIRNGQALCKDCHAAAHPEKGGRRGSPPRY